MRLCHVYDGVEKYFKGIGVNKRKRVNITREWKRFDGNIVKKKCWERKKSKKNET